MNTIVNLFLVISNAHNVKNVKAIKNQFLTILMFFYATVCSHVASFMKIFDYLLLAFCCTIIFRRDDGAALIESSSHPPSFIQTRSGVVAILTHGSPSVHIHHLKILHLHPLGCMGFILFKGSNSPRLKRFYLHGV